MEEESFEASLDDKPKAPPEFIQYQVDDGVARITLDRPKASNAMNIQMMEEIGSVLEAVDMNPDVKILLLQGDDKAFSSGLDIADHTEENAYQMMNEFSNVFHRLMKLDAVSVSVVKGMALGGGCELAVSCDFSFAAEDAKLGQPEIKAGLFPPVAAVVYPRIIGLRRTFEMLLTGRIYGAKEAERIGLITRAVAGPQLEEEVQRWMDFLKSFSAPVLKLTRQAISGSLTLPFDEALRYVEEIYLNELMATEDVKEGLKALLERRKPVWKHR
jgi:cyclohexa-1,5-dienecarbonyl-CoA hydratase